MSSPDDEAIDDLYDWLGEPDPGEDLSAVAINRSSIEALGLSASTTLGGTWDHFDPTDAHSVAKVRMTGDAVVQNAAPVRVAAPALTTLQELISAIAMARRGKRNLSGFVPAAIRDLTDLFFVPIPRPGSVVFDLVGPGRSDEAAQIPGVTASLPTEADAAVEQLVNLLAASGEGPGESRVALGNSLVNLGPRVSTQLRRLAAFPTTAGLNLEIAWKATSGATVKGRLGANEANVIMDVITETRSSAEIQILEGELVTVSSVNPLALRLRDGRTISVAPAEPEMPGQLARYFNRWVTAVLEVEVTTHPVSGRASRQYTLVSVDPDLFTSAPDEDSEDG
ncbi:hypothetical protein [Dermatobacter hominis]|uniref:hypothetical protein n=1 Tax=Dermatobacter hominis TaxID=2884263 RepID=UPI001D123A20|nr:hypothetical protein [Dermatobacter hominis]UDY36284.1 hypothetical protein LH044_01825 [Dermatobacter hominis]